MEFFDEVEPPFWKSKENELKRKILQQKREIEVLKLKIEKKNTLLKGNQYLQYSDNEISDTNTQLLRSIFVENPTAIIISDYTGQISLCNNNACNLFGYENHEFLKINIDKLVPISDEKHAQLRQSYYKNPEQRGMGIGRDIHAKRKDGSVFPVEIGLNSIKIKDKKYVIAVIVDLTIRNKLKDLLDESNKKLVKENKQYSNNIDNFNLFFATTKSEFDNNILYLNDDTVPTLNPSIIEKNNTIDLKTILSKYELDKRNKVIIGQLKKGGYYCHRYDVKESENTCFIERGKYTEFENQITGFNVCIYLESKKNVS